MSYRNEFDVSYTDLGTALFNSWLRCEVTKTGGRSDGRVSW
jgi:hypothetical protein